MKLILILTDNNISSDKGIVSKPTTTTSSTTTPVRPVRQPHYGKSPRFSLQFMHHLNDSNSSIPSNNSIKRSTTSSTLIDHEHNNNHSDGTSNSNSNNNGSSNSNSNGNSNGSNGNSNNNNNNNGALEYCYYSSSYCSYEFIMISSIVTLIVANPFLFCKLYNFNYTYNYNYNYNSFHSFLFLLLFYSIWSWIDNYVENKFPFIYLVCLELIVRTYLVGNDNIFMCIQSILLVYFIHSYLLLNLLKYKFNTLRISAHLFFSYSSFFSFLAPFFF